MRLSPLRGFTLAEMLVALALAAILASVCAGLLVSQLRISRRSTERIGLEHNHLLLHEALRYDISLATSSSISINAAANGIAFQPADTLTLQGTLAYSTSSLSVYQFHPGQRKLVRDAWTVSPPVALQSPAQRLVPSQWLTLATATSPNRRTWDDLRSFQVRTEEPGNAWLNPRLWVDCEWQHEPTSRLWRVSYCLYSRQRP